MFKISCRSAHSGYMLRTAVILCWLLLFFLPDCKTNRWLPVGRSVIHEFRRRTCWLNFASVPVNAHCHRRQWLDTPRINLRPQGWPGRFHKNSLFLFQCDLNPFTDVNKIPHLDGVLDVVEKLENHFLQLSCLSTCSQVTVWKLRNR